MSQVYETMELSRLVELAPFATTTDLEKIVVETATSNNIQVGGHQLGPGGMCRHHVLLWAVVLYRCVLTTAPSLSALGWT